MRYNTINIDGLNVFYRESGSRDMPELVLFHGFPTSSHMFRNLMPMLDDRFHMIAPDYPGFGRTESPERSAFAYSFGNIAECMGKFLDAIGVEDFYMYVFDYGAPIGFRIALKHPGRIRGIISQNGNAYEEGLDPKWEARKRYWQNPTPALREEFKGAFAPATVIDQYVHGTKPGSVSPDGYSLDLYYSLTIPDYAEKQSDLILDYRTNVELYPAFQEFLRKWQPPLLAAWGRNDPSFIPAGACAFQKDDPKAVVHLVDSGHFALESCCGEIAEKIREWSDHLKPNAIATNGGRHPAFAIRGSRRVSILLLALTEK